MEIRDLPLHATNTHLYNMLLYFSDDKQSNEYWLLYDDINGQFHALTDVRKFLPSNSSVKNALEHSKQNRPTMLTLI